MRIPVKLLISSALILFFYGALQGGFYFMKNRVQELAIAAGLGLYVYTAIQAAFSVKNIRWSWWAISAPLFSLFIVINFGIVFAVNTGESPVPSILASRYFLLIFIIPVIYFLYHLGYTLKEIEQIFYISLVILLLNYVFHYFRIDLKAAYFSTDHFTASLVTYDEWRGYRLKPPMFVTFIVLLHSGMSLFTRLRPIIVLRSFLLIGLTCYILLINMSRASLAAIFLSMSLYPIFFSRPNRINLLVLGVPSGLLVFFFIIAILLQAIVAHFTSDWSFQVRMKSWEIALSNFAEHPIFGFGQASYYTKSYQDLFGKKFFPSDLGIIGVAFKYGLVGVASFIFYNFYILYRLMRVNWLFRKLNGRHNPLIWSLFILSISLIINMILQ
ncbi:O-antigen ligase family protein, partial [Desulfobacterales bacterium HSG17]|nr:O-antigen ligase family protein [Desulfobacterales bacterium HSG17]